MASESVWAYRGETDNGTSNVEHRTTNDERRTGGVGRVQKVVISIRWMTYARQGRIEPAGYGRCKRVYTGGTRNRLPYLWVALLLCISACTRTEQSAAPEADQTQDLPPAVSPFPPTDPTQPPLVAPLDSDQAKAMQKAWADHLGTPVQIANPLGVKFNLIPPGDFTMGNPESELDLDGDETQHRV